MLASLKRSKTSDIAAEVRTRAVRSGYVEDPPDDLGDQEITRQNDLARFVHLAEEFDDGSRTAADFVADIELRFGGGGEGRGVNLLTMHRAKGLEFDAVFLPRVEEGEIPFRRSKSAGAIAEERRLFYVGITRARTHLAITWVHDGRRKPSIFVTELQGQKVAARAPARADDRLMDELKRWRLERAKTDEVPAYVVFHDTTLRAIAETQPRNLDELAGISGVGPSKLERYGAEVLALIG